MKSKWSKIIKADHTAMRIETVTMEEFCDTDPMEMNSNGDPEQNGQAPDEPVRETHDCTLLQRESYEAGYARGLEDGRAQMHAQVDAELTHALNIVTQAGLARLRAVQEMENVVVELALAVAKKVIRREAEIDKETIARQVHHAIGYLTQSTTIKIRVNPDDAERLKSLQLMDRENHPVSLVIEHDPMMEPGGCLIETPALVVDATIEHQLAVIHQHLTRPHASSMNE